MMHQLEQKRIMTIEYASPEQVSGELLDKLWRKAPRQT
jgi:hypothetical protein